MTDNPKYPFEVSEKALEARIDEFVETTISELSSFYLSFPRGDNFVEYDAFRLAYESLEVATMGFRTLDRYTLHQVVRAHSLALVVLRCMVGLSPPELADLANAKQGVSVDQGFARTVDLKARQNKPIITKDNGDTTDRIHALVDAACAALESGAKPRNPVLIDRLDKVDTAQGLSSLRKVAKEGVEYSILLYERMLGRPFASHRDSVSEKVGEVIEEAIITALTTAGVPFYQSRRIEKIPGFDQSPDFLVPDKLKPKIVIEAKLTQDDGTARDKVTRVQHLNQLSEGGKRFEVIACIDGRGFSVRREDMKKLLRATRGKVFSVATMPHLVANSRLKNFAK